MERPFQELAAAASAGLLCVDPLHAARAHLLGIGRPVDVLAVPAELGVCGGEPARIQASEVGLATAQRAPDGHAEERACAPLKCLSPGEPRAHRLPYVSGCTARR